MKRELLSQSTKRWQGAWKSKGRNSDCRFPHPSLCPGRCSGYIRSRMNVTTFPLNGMWRRFISGMSCPNPKMERSQTVLKLGLEASWHGYNLLYEKRRQKNTKNTVWRHMYGWGWGEEESVVMQLGERQITLKLIFFFCLQTFLVFLISILSPEPKNLFSWPGIRMKSVLSFFLFPRSLFL